MIWQFLWILILGCVCYYCTVSSKDEFDAPESFIIDPVDLNGFFGDDGKIYGYEDLKVRCALTIIEKKLFKNYFI